MNQANILAIIDANIRMYDLDRVTERVFAPIRGFSQVEMQFGSFGHKATVRSSYTTEPWKERQSRCCMGLIPVRDGCNVEEGLGR